jgi:hypothetical protein
MDETVILNTAVTTMIIAPSITLIVQPYQFSRYMEHD